MSEKVNITKLVIKDFKGIIYVEIVPDGDAFYVYGPNGAGKSTCLDAFSAVLGGKSLCPDKPIRAGEKKAVIAADLSNGLHVERTFTEKDSYVKVTAGNKEYKKPQELLDYLFTALGFDPLLFANMKPQDQARELMRVVSLGIDPIKHEEARKVLYDARADANRDLRNAEVRVKALPYFDGAPAAVIPAGELAGQVAEGEGVNAERERAADRLNAIARQISELQAEAEKLLNVSAQPPVNVAALKERLARVEADNDKVRANQAYLAAMEGFDHAKNRADAAEDDLKAHDKRKEDALAAAVFPVPGLSFAGDGVALNGIPLEQCSQSEVLRTSVGVAMALNPELRDITLRQAAFLDAAGRELITKLAAEKGYRVWMEVVEAPKDAGACIEIREGRNANTYASTLRGGE